MLGARLRRLRVTKGMTQRQLAAPRYTHAYVSTIEAGRRQPSAEALEHFAGKLGVTVEELSSGRPHDLEAKLELGLQKSRLALSSGRLSEADESLRDVVRAAKKFGLRRFEARAEEIRGLRVERGGDPAEALKHYERAEELLGEEPPTAKVDAIAGKARVLQAIGDVRYAVHILETVGEDMERLGLRDPHALARLHASLVDAYLDAGLYQQAAASAAQLEVLAPMMTDPLRIAQMNLHVAHLYLVQGKISDAVRSLERCEDAYMQLALKTEIGYAHLAKGYVLSREKRFSDARRELSLALEIFDETGDAKDLTRTLNELARVDRLEGRLDSARRLLERSIGLIRDSDTPILAWAHRELGLVVSSQNHTMAEKHFRTAIELFERTEQSVEIALTYRVLGDLLTGVDQQEAGCDAYRTGIMALETGS